ncbi:MAG TPA: MarR family transcriptional regulator [Blastocatellia bacterium]|nr:MarR family transcriptional regulator [Blastocatellia bacterium]
MGRDDLSGIHLWLVLWRAARAVEGHAVRSVSAAGLCASDFGVLEALLHKGAMPVNAIGKKVLLTSGSITTAVDRLERRGLVERRDAPEDRRARIVHLTPEGRQLIKRAFARHAADMGRAASALNESERKTLLRLLKKLGYGAAALVSPDPNGTDEAPT